MEPTMDVTEEHVTSYLRALGAGEGAALGELFAAAYTVLRDVAHVQRRRWSGEETLSTTALVHEAYLKLSQQASPQWQSREHFLRVAARAMRHILIDYAERRHAAKRGGDRTFVPVDGTPLIDESHIEDMLALSEALTLLARQNPRQAQVVECRFFAGLEVEDTAAALGVSSTTVKRDWRRAQAWLYRQLGPRPAGGHDASQGDRGS
ncbi:MAG: sigma-70 family RNA polymerase sigma factor [Luteitalea sp.]|nr:sigma-70 family RNA polymerase sigma factor [Luteitalea sp.]